MVKRGRPRKRDSKNSRVELRISLDEKRKLSDLVDDTGMSTSEILRKSLGLFYDMFYSQ